VARQQPIGSHPPRAAKEPTLSIERMACIADLQAVARRRLPAFVFDYFHGGAGEDRGAIRNETALGAVLLRPKRLRGSCGGATVKLFGRPYALPLGVAPVGMGDLAWPGTDLSLARLAEREKIPYVLSTAATTSIEKIAAAAPTVSWFQLYLSRHEEISQDLMRRAWDAGMRVLVLTVDVPATARRNRQIRNQFRLPFRLSARLIWDMLSHPRWSALGALHGSPKLENYGVYAQSENFQVVGRYISETNKSGLLWDDLLWVRDLWRGTLVVKGILDPADAAKAEAAGADGIWVSNHGGRQLESAPATIRVLPGIRAAVSADIPVLFDSGVRSGEDVVKARASGADFIFCGRPFIYGAGAFGNDGIEKAFAILSAEIVCALTQVGCSSLAELDSSFIEPA
jgi:isopentenyl diphosphate isomerase/L-lactate dehydrogenase-like FMN-dependent dehydrogenase